MILERNPVNESLVESKVVKCELAIVRRKKKAQETLQEWHFRASRIVSLDPAEEKSQNSKKDVASDKEGFLGPGSETACVSKSGGVQRQWLSNRQKKSQDPPDLTDDVNSLNRADRQVPSSMSLSSDDRDSSVMEHPMAIKNTTHSREMSPITKASSSCRDLDWRKAQTKEGNEVQIHWEPPAPDRVRKIHCHSPLPTKTVMSPKE